MATESETTDPHEHGPDHEHDHEIAAPEDRRLHHIPPAALTEDTMQTSGMRRREAISGKTVGSSKIWMGETIVPPETGSGNHHHGESETAIYVVEGNPEFVFLDADEEVRVRTKPGDYVYVPPFVPHREENPDPEHDAVVVIGRSTQEAIVVNLEDLVWVGPVAVGRHDLERPTWHDHEIDQRKPDGDEQRSDDR
ncbi:cupin domain-containing protein [Microlunatus soli]|uniref:Uncharacterized protein, RmlC-like cupin domain n=1 Tax=Microlunatus soli TaxID=630515 RepID=A0A1H1YMX5_9ACTN|nr:cupin domain-containing protein [Microlunatus soli]SDT22751.1 Uncharacterized protein, RmlC-like cupin domain [Microlunatus soli]